MKASTLCRFALALLSLALFSCQVQKRLYRQGWYIAKRERHRIPETRDAHVPRGSSVVAEACSPPQCTVARSRYFAPEARPRSNADVDRQIHLPVPQVPAAARRLQQERHMVCFAVADAAQPRTVDPWGLVAFALSIGAWFTTGYLTLPLFLLAAILAVVSLNKMGNSPERYVLKTLSLVALIIAGIGAALSLFTLVLQLFS